MRVYLNALIATLGVGLVLVGLFGIWREKSAKNHGVEAVDLLNVLETQGMLDFEVKAVAALNRESFKLSDFKGKKIILNFWASWCGPCVDEIPSMISLTEKMPDLVVVAVSADSSMESILDFLKLFPKLNQKSNFVIGWDEDLSVGRRYQAERLPESYVIGSDFKLARKVSGSIKWDTPDAIEFLKSIK